MLDVRQIYLTIGCCNLNSNKDDTSVSVANCNFVPSKLLLHRRWIGPRFQYRTGTELSYCFLKYSWNLINVSRDEGGLSNK